MHLHHYETSPFSEKARLLFGLKGARWRSVIQPVIMPKPDLTPLTGGYRRIPVLQVGSDVFLDTPLILTEIDARLPSPPMATAFDHPMNLWTDRQFFQTTVALVFASRADATPAAFIADRERLSGRAFDIAAMKAAAPAARIQWRSQAAWIETGLRGRPYLAGERAGLADVAAYMNVWWLTTAAPEEAEALLKGLGAVVDWRDRLKAAGHGERVEASPQAALEAARTSEPGAAPPHDENDPSGLQPGDPVVLCADDYGRDPIEGVLVSASPLRIVLARTHALTGRVHIHAPRVGYFLSRGAG